MTGEVHCLSCAAYHAESMTCRRYAMRAPYSQWPTMTPDGWCFEHVPKENDLAAKLADAENEIANLKGLLSSMMGGQ